MYNFVIRKIFLIVKMLEVQKKKEEEEKSDAASSSSIAALTRQEKRGYRTLKPSFMIIVAEGAFAPPNHSAATTNASPVFTV